MGDDRDQEPPEIDLSLEDLDAEESRTLPPAPSMPEAAENVLVIRSEDLADVPELPGATTYPPAQSFPPAGTFPAPQAKGKRGILSGGLVGSQLLQMALAGGLGGLLAWALTEPQSYLGDVGESIARARDLGTYGLLCGAIATIGAAALALALGFSQWTAGGTRNYIGPLVGLLVGALAGASAAGIGYWRAQGYQPSAEHVVAHVTLFAAIIGICTGVCLGLVEGLYAGNVPRALRGGAIGLGCGLVCGGLGGLFAQIVFGTLVPREITEFSLQLILARTIGWGIAGLGIGVGLGLAHGLPSKSNKKIVNGLMGGVIGGFAGGFLFDPLGLVISGLGSRLLAIGLIGALSGAAIGLIEEIRKQAWLAIVGGPLTGKQFILYSPVTRIGRAPHCEIALLKDHSLAPEHCVIELTGRGYQLRDLGGGTFVNGRPIQQYFLRAGDIIQIGATTLEYQDRALTSGRPM